MAENSIDPFLKSVAASWSSGSNGTSVPPRRFLAHMDFALLSGALSDLVGPLEEVDGDVRGAVGGPDEIPARARMSKLSLFFVLIFRPLRRKDDERRGSEVASRTARDVCDDCGDCD